MTNIVNNIIATSVLEEVCNDKDSLLDKQKVMKKQRWNSLFYSTSDTFKFLAAVTLAAGMAIIGASLKGVTTLAAAGTAISGSPVGLTFLTVAAVCTAIAVGSQFISSRYFHSGNFDALEINARHTAKYLVKEIKKENACITEQQNPARGDGKSWQQVVKEQQAAGQSQSL